MLDLIFTRLIELNVEKVRHNFTGYLLFLFELYKQFEEPFEIVQIAIDPEEIDL